MPGKTNATQRSLNHLRKNGWIAHVVEKWIPPRGTMKFGVRIDVWAFGDILICRAPVTVNGQVAVPGRTALVQCFPEARFKDHREKLKGIPEVEIWKAAGNKVYLHGWSLRPKGGVRGAKKIWMLHEEEA